MSAIGKYRYFFAAMLFICSLNVAGQEPAMTDSIPDFDAPRVIVISDTTDFTTFLPVWNIESYSIHSPAKAAIMSAVLPGLGQIYNKKYWKVPIVFAAVGTSVGVFLKWQNEYNRSIRAYIDIFDNDPFTNFHETFGFPSFYDDNMKKQYITRRKDQLRVWRDWSIVAMVAAYTLNIIDANVDAHLIDFSIDDNISLNIKPYFFGNGFDSQKIGLSLRLTF